MCGERGDSLPQPSQPSDPRLCRRRSIMVRCRRARGRRGWPSRGAPPEWPTRAIRACSPCACSRTPCCRRPRRSRPHRPRGAGWACSGAAAEVAAWGERAPAASAPSRAPAPPHRSPRRWPRRAPCCSPPGQTPGPAEARGEGGGAGGARTSLVWSSGTFASRSRLGPSKGQVVHPQWDADSPSNQIQSGQAGVQGYHGATRSRGSMRATG